jgi:hypothetical protein
MEVPAKARNMHSRKGDYHGRPASDDHSERSSANGSDENVQEVQGDHSEVQRSMPELRGELEARVQKGMVLGAYRSAAHRIRIRIMHSCCEQVGFGCCKWAERYGDVGEQYDSIEQLFEQRSKIERCRLQQHGGWYCRQPGFGIIGFGRCGANGPCEL